MLAAVSDQCCWWARGPCGLLSQAWKDVPARALQTLLHALVGPATL